MSSIIERLLSWRRPQEQKSLEIIDIQDIIDEVYPGYPTSQDLFKVPISRDELFRLASELFSTTPVEFVEDENAFMHAALDEIENVATEQEFQSVLDLAGRAFVLASNAHFPSIDQYILGNDIKNTGLNLFHPKRLVGLSSYMAALSYFDLQIKYGGIPSCNDTEELYTFVNSHINPMYYRNNETIYLLDSQVYGGSLHLQPHGELIEHFLAAQHAQTGKFITPDDWLLLSDQELIEQRSTLQMIYPDVNIDAVVTVIPKLPYTQEFAGMLIK